MPLKYLKYLLQTKEKKKTKIQIVSSFRGFEFNVEVCEQIVSGRAQKCGKGNARDYKRTTENIPW